MVYKNADAIRYDKLCKRSVTNRHLIIVQWQVHVYGGLAIKSSALYPQNLCKCLPFSMKSWKLITERCSVIWEVGAETLHKLQYKYIFVLI